MSYTKGHWAAVLARRGKLGHPETMVGFWLVHQVHAENRPQPVICEIPEESGIPPEERRANAQLIAAAPDLHAAAVDALVALTGVVSAAAIDARSKLRAALARAEVPE